MVASRIKEIYFELSKCSCPLGDTKKKSPINPIKIPANFQAVGLILKNNVPIITAQRGVSELSIPVKELSNLVSAKQNRKAGMKLPINPDNNTSPILFVGICLKALKAKGIKTIPALNILNAATSYGLSCSMPIFISRNELPHINDKMVNNNQLMNLLPKIFILDNVTEKSASIFIWNNTTLTFVA